MAKKSQRSSTSRPTPRRRQQSSGLWWFITGVVVGVVATRLMMRAPGPSAPVAPAASTAQPAAPQRPIEFKFPKVLNSPETEVGTTPPPPPAHAAPRPARQPSPAPRPPAQSPSAPATPSPAPAPAARSAGGYVVQVASLARAQDAERLKAELALLGVSTHVERAVLKNGRTTHRVRTGVFATRAEAKQADAALRRRGRQPIILPVR